MRIHPVCILALLPISCFAAQKIAVIAHRGEHLRHPENTMPAYRAAIDCGADFIEVDVRTSKDGRLVVMHDGKADRTTNGTGAIKETTFAQIRALDAGAKFSKEFQGTPVPTFEEVLALAKGKIGIYVDTKDATAGDILAALDRYGMADQVVVYGGLQYLKDVHAMRPGIRVMPEAVSIKFLTPLMADLKPRVVAFGEGDWKDEIIAVAKQGSAGIYVDRLGAEDDPEHWQDAINRGATGIQTNRPAELVRYLRSNGEHE